jgi:hypothetical protein
MKGFSGRHHLYLYRAAALLTGVTFGWVVSQPVVAELPEQALISDINGNLSELAIRRNQRREPPQIGTSKLNQFRDALVTVPRNDGGGTTARAWLRFLDASGQDMGLYVQTNEHPEPAIYYFPCQIQGGDQFIGWGLQSNEAQGRGCEEGIQVIPGDGSGAMVPGSAIALKQTSLAQGAIRQLAYCSASDATGKIGFASSPTADPCTPAIQQCQAAGGNGCEANMTGLWWTNEAEMEAILSCNGNRIDAVSGTGDAIASLVTPLLAKAQGPDCYVQLLRPGDVVIAPASDAEVRATGATDILVRTRSTAEGIDVDVIRGAIRTSTTQPEPPRILNQGQRLVVSEQGSQVTNFDRQATLTSVDMEVLCAFATNSPDRPAMPACQEGLGIDTTTAPRVEFCNREQGSGGQLGERRIMQMSSNQGEIRLNYEMYEVPDRIEIIQDGRLIFDTGFISGRNSVTIPFQGQSGRLEINVTGNPGIDTTLWTFTLQCP